MIDLRIALECRMAGEIIAGLLELRHWTHIGFLVLVDSTVTVLMLKWL